MLISTPDELRLYAPSSAIDHIEAMSGYFNASESDFLKEKLGQPLYASLVSYYRDLRNGENGVMTFVQTITEGEDLTPYAELLTLAQRIIAFDALGRAIDMQAISVNGSGINISTADDYPKADREAVIAYKQTCIKESHAAVNALLQTLEEWTQEVSAPAAASDTESTAPEGSPSGSDSPETEEKSEIVSLWRKSRYFYLAAGLILPSATIVQEYLDIYNSREKYIQMLPDLRYIQEDIIAPIIGEEFLEHLITLATDGFPEGTTESEQKLMLRIIHTLRKCTARHLESRTMQIKVGDPRRETAHNEAVRLASDLSDFLQLHQADFPEASIEVFKSSPLYKDPASAGSSAGDEEEYTSQFENNASGSVMFVTPALS